MSLSHLVHAARPARVVGGLVGLALAAGLTTYAAPAEASPTRSTTSTTSDTPTEVDPPLALHRAEQLATGRVIGPGLHLDGTQVQSDLFRLLGDLPSTDRLRGRALLARPTDGRRDQFGDGYRTRSRRTCGPHVCVQWVPRTSDAPADRAGVSRTLKVMEKVWRVEVGKMGYRAPLSDGDRGGDGRFDVYLRDLGAQGAYGYCTPESIGGDRSGRTAAGYCVLDNDFDPVQFGGAEASVSLKVTAAHEFFHAIQLAYDARSDPWFAESTAVWMEDQVFDDADDNRQYLPYGQLGAPDLPLDRFQPTGFAQYGNWVFWQRLSERFGDRIVRRTWERAGRGAFSAEALRQQLSDQRGGLSAVLAEYGAALNDAAHTYSEGADWPEGAAPAQSLLSPTVPQVELRDRLDHLSTRTYRFAPDPAVPTADEARLKIKVRGPSNPATAPGAWVRVTGVDGSVGSQWIRLNARGRGKAEVGFTTGIVTSVDVTIANASTRFRCGRGTTMSCRGRALDDGRRFRVVATLQ